MGCLCERIQSFLASRVFSGFGMAPYEVVVQITLKDMYFVHERVTRIAIWNLFLLAGIAGGGLVSGYIIEDLGYRWTFGLCAILFGLCVFGNILFVPETSYRRGDFHAMYYPGTKEDVLEKTGQSYEHKEIAGEPIPTVAGNRPNVRTHPKMPYIQSLKVFTGRYTNAPFWKIFMRPLVIFWYPAVLWGFLIYGTTLTWIVVFSVVNAEIFTLPPYNFSVSETGLISLSPFILTTIGEIVSGPLNDWIGLHLTKRNHGIYEPEFRLVLIIPTILLGVVGFFGFGATVHYQTHWSGPVLTFGLANMALAFASGCVFGM